MKASRASHLVLLGGAALAFGALPSCVAKSLYLQKVDEAVRWRSQAEEYQKSLGVAAELRARLEGQIKAEERKTAICEISLKGLRERGEKFDGEIAEVRERLKKTADDVNELRAKLSTTQETVRACEARIVQLRTTHAAEARREPDLSDAIKVLRAEIDGSNGAITVTRPKGAVVLRIPHALLFRRRSPVLTRDGGELVGRIADALKQLKDRRFAVEGHEDGEPPPRKFGTPFDLSLTQAYRVTLELVRTGLHPAHVLAAGFGSNQPLAAQGSENAALQNRRIEIRITPAPPADKLEVIGPDPGQ